MPKTMQQLSRNEVHEITRTFRGELPGVPNPSAAAIARRFNITESDAQALREAATTSAPKAKAVAPTRTVAESARERFIHESAEITQQRANATTEKDPPRWTPDEIAAALHIATAR